MNLSQLASKFDSDKGPNHHNYTPVYEKYFTPLKENKVVILELGVGGYHHIHQGGASLKMWAEFFPHGSIVGIDNHLKQLNVPPRVHVYRCDQNDKTGLESIIEKHGMPDIIIDDASHINKLTIESFNILFPLLKPGGIYVVEDIESSWCPETGWAAGCADPDNYHAQTTVNFFRWMINELNAKFIPGGWEMQYGVSSIHFYYNMVFIFKK